jgi:hypothetical protein
MHSTYGTCLGTKESRCTTTQSSTWPSTIPTLLTPLPKEDIKDKSKANGLAKAITCLQATWFTVQCVYRIVQGLSLSLLELNTVAHALFTLVAYCLWRDEPFDIETPTIIRGQDADGICALLCRASNTDWKTEIPRSGWRRLHPLM